VLVFVRFVLVRLVAALLCCLLLLLLARQHLGRARCGRAALAQRTGCRAARRAAGEQVGSIWSAGGGREAR
jgi:hypothetical protein